MIVDNIYWGFDQSAWEDIFSLLKVLLPGLFMAFFGAYYQTRKKKEIARKHPTPILAVWTISATFAPC